LWIMLEGRGRDVKAEIVPEVCQNSLTTDTRVPETKKLGAEWTTTT